MCRSTSGSRNIHSIIIHSIRILCDSCMDIMAASWVSEQLLSEHASHCYANFLLIHGAYLASFPGSPCTQTASDGKLG